jgi:hypothetical protein
VDKFSPQLQIKKIEFLLTKNKLKTQRAESFQILSNFYLINIPLSSYYERTHNYESLFSCDNMLIFDHHINI